MNINPLHLIDFYKSGHQKQYPNFCSMVYSNLTPRGSRIDGIDKIVVFGIQYFIKEYLISRFNKDFFEQPKAVVVNQYKRRLDNALGKDAVSMEHIEALHDLQYLPIKIKALPEGSLCPMRVPFLTIRNTLPEFFWLTNFLETILCNTVWQPITSATIAYQYRKILDRYAKETSDIPEFVDWQGHDFSMRGMSSLESACTSGAGHLLSFTGTDTIPAIDFLEQYYGADSDKELIGGSVSASEHSCASMGSNEGNDFNFIKRMITEVYPNGIVSVIMDTYDYWRALTQYLPLLKNEIMDREGKLVCRPDSGDPVKIICGDKDADLSHVRMGSIEVLWNIFGGTVNSKGYRQLDPHIGLIYGDSITLQRAEGICKRLKEKGFASTNVVYGIGSYTYQMVTRDTFGLAMKATYGEIDGKPVEIYKDPKTDSGIKKSARGLLRVNTDYTLSESVNWGEESQGLLRTVFENGYTISYSLREIRSRLRENNVG